MATHHRMGGVLHFLLLLAAIAVLTELGLRFRRDWQVRHRVAEHRPVSEHRKAA